MRIVLIGFMGAGKSYMGKLLAEYFEVMFVDIDDQIETKTGLSINEIFMHGGESYFRKLERLVINDLHKEKIIATGAGIIDSLQNRDWLKEAYNYVVWLNPDWETIFTRISGSSRPKVRTLNMTDVQQLWENRCLLYEECADITYEGENIQELIELIKPKI